MIFPDPELANILVRLDQPIVADVRPRVCGKTPVDKRWVQITAEQIAAALGQPLALSDGRQLVTGVRKHTPWAGYLDPNKALSPEWIDFGDVKRAYAQILNGQ